MTKPKFDTYEPGEPDAVKAAAAAAQAKKDRHDRFWDNLWDFVDTAKWYALVIVVVAAIAFGLNRFVHAINEDSRYRQEFVASCMLDGNTVGYFNSEMICFQGVIVSAIDADQKKDCLAQGNYPIDVSGNNATMYMCMRGKIVAVR